MPLLMIKYYRTASDATLFQFGFSSQLFISLCCCGLLFAIVYLTSKILRGIRRFVTAFTAYRRNFGTFWQQSLQSNWNFLLRSTCFAGKFKRWSWHHTIGAIDSIFFALPHQLCDSAFAVAMPFRQKKSGRAERTDVGAPLLRTVNSEHQRSER